MWRGEGGAGDDQGLQSHSKLDGELLFTMSCNVRAESHSMKLVGDGFKRSEIIQTVLHSKV